jgi:hypothetical protein
MAEGVPTDLFVNVGLSCHRQDVPLHQIVRPVGLLCRLALTPLGRDQFLKAFPSHRIGVALTGGSEVSG